MGADKFVACVEFASGVLYRDCKYVFFSVQLLILPNFRSFQTSSRTLYYFDLSSTDFFFLKKTIAFLFLLLPTTGTDPELLDLGLSHNTRLTSLTIEIPWLGNLRHLPVTNAWIIALLSRTPHTSPNHTIIISPSAESSFERVEIHLPWLPLFSGAGASASASASSIAIFQDILRWKEIGSAVSTSLFGLSRNPRAVFRVFLSRLKPAGDLAAGSAQTQPQLEDRAVERVRRAVAEQVQQLLLSVMPRQDIDASRVQVLWK